MPNTIVVSNDEATKSIVKSLTLYSNLCNIIDNIKQKNFNVTHSLVGGSRSSYRRILKSKNVLCTQISSICFSQDFIFIKDNQYTHELPVTEDVLNVLCSLDRNTFEYYTAKGKINERDIYYLEIIMEVLIHET